jgi:mRNA interferase RelE/StbE
LWSVFIHPLVWSEDLKPLNPPVQKKIVATFRSRLSIDPKGYGRPLRGELAGLWKLRVGDYRVIYRIVESKVEVLVLKVGIRRDFEVYRELLHRLRRLEH